MNFLLADSPGPLLLCAVTLTTYSTASSSPVTETIVVVLLRDWCEGMSWLVEDTSMVYSSTAGPGGAVKTTSTERDDGMRRVMEGVPGSDMWGEWRQCINS